MDSMRKVPRPSHELYTLGGLRVHTNGKVVRSLEKLEGQHLRMDSFVAMESRHVIAPAMGHRPDEYCSGGNRGRCSGLCLQVSSAIGIYCVDGWNRE